MRFIKTLIATFLFGAVCTLSEIRFDCPAPRIEQTEQMTVAPCGKVSNGQSMLQLPISTLSPGPNIIEFSEPISRRGSPFRIALSMPNQEYFEDCILLDHIPHNNLQSGSGKYKIVVDIPDIKCDVCALQLIQVDTAAIDQNLGQAETNCTYDPHTPGQWAEGDCGQVFYSCANVRITGKKGFDSALCVQPWGWNYADTGYVYTEDESGQWSPDNNTLIDDGVPLAVKDINGAMGACDVMTTAAPTTSPSDSPAPSDQGQNDNVVVPKTNAGAIVAGIFGTIFGLGLIIFVGKKIANQHEDKSAFEFSKL